MRKSDTKNGSRQLESKARPSYEVKTIEAGSYSILHLIGGENEDEGIVYKAIYRGAIVCAFKAIKVDPNKTGKKVEEIIGPLINEVKLLSLLKHSNLVRIMDYGDGARVASQVQEKEKTLDTWSSRDSEISQHLFREPITYIAMDYIDGETLHKKLSEKRDFDEVFLQDLLKWLYQISDVMAYLHQRGILHMDIKSRNIMIEFGTKNAILIDLGDSVIADIDRFKEYFETEGTELKADDQIRVLFDPDYASEEIKPLRGNLVPRHKIKNEFFPKKDLYGLGVVIQEIVERICSKDVKNLDVKNSEIVRGLREIASRLINGYYANEPQFQKDTAAHFASEDIRHSDPRNLYSLGVSELSNCGEGRFIQLSGESVWISKRLSYIIDHPFFQRLRNIVQLNYVHLIYPDAHHTRFSHCIYTYHLARRAILSLLSDVRFRINIDACDIQGTLLFSLLHDIGHYPLSHMFEDFAGGKSPRADPIVNDVELFKLMIDGGNDDSLVGRAIKEKLTEHGDVRSIADLITEYYDESTLKAMYSIWASVVGQKADKPVHRVLAGLVSSAIDIDKVAYLSVDSAMSGVNFGKGIDIQAYIHNLRMPLLDDTNGNKPILALSDKGFAAAESIILARYWMLSRVYWHHANRGFMSCFKFLLQELLDEQKLKFSEYFRNVFWGHEKDATQYISNLYNALLEPVRKTIINPLEGINEGIRPKYKRFFVVTSHSKNSTEECDEYQNIYDYLLSAKADEFKVLEGIQGKVTEFLNRKRKQDYNLDKISGLMYEKNGSSLLKLGCFLIDIPRKRRDLLDLKTIYVISSDDYSTEREPLSSSSQLLRNLGEETLIRIKKCRIFIHPGLYECLEENSWIKEVRDIVLEELSAQTRVRS